MVLEKNSKGNPGEYSRCEERHLSRNSATVLKTDLVMKQLIHHAFWADDILRVLDYMEIDVHVKNRIVYLYGHIVSTNSLSRVLRAIETVPGVLGVKNNLVTDDTLMTEVASSLGMLEHVYHCKFFTGASHGVISLNGTVSNEHVKFLAIKCAAANPKVRGVINSIHAQGSAPINGTQVFMLPTLGENIYFLDGVSGVVKQVVIDPNNRLVVAMTILGKFTEQIHQGGETPPERLIVLDVGTVRYLTKDSGFLYIRSNQKDQYMDFDASNFTNPEKTWIPPYPYCTEDVLFRVTHVGQSTQYENEIEQFPLTDTPGKDSFKAQFYSHNSLGA